jgi:hypothetical protein
MAIADAQEKAKGVVNILGELHAKNVVWTEVKTIVLESATYT